MDSSSRKKWVITIVIVIIIVIIVIIIIIIIMVVVVVFCVAVAEVPKRWDSGSGFHIGGGMVVMLVWQYFWQGASSSANNIDLELTFDAICAINRKNIDCISSVLVVVIVVKIWDTWTTLGIL